MRGRTSAALVLAVLVLFAGCAALDGGSNTTDGPVEANQQAPGETNVTQTLQIEVNESTAGSEWTAISATYPRDRFTVDSAQHDQLVLGVDTDGDGEIDREFDESHVSGVNNNDFSFTIELDTGYILQQGDVVVVQYPAVDNPSEPGEYDVEVTLNEAQTATGTIEIGE